MLKDITHIQTKNFKFLEKKLKTKVYKNEELTIKDKLFADILINHYVKEITSTFCQSFNPFSIRTVVTDGSIDWNIKACHYKDIITSSIDKYNALSFQERDTDRIALIKVIYSYLAEHKKTIKEEEKFEMATTFNEYVINSFLSEKEDIEDLVYFDNSKFKIVFSIKDSRLSLLDKKANTTFYKKMDITSDFFSSAKELDITFKKLMQNNFEDIIRQQRHLTFKNF